MLDGQNHLVKQGWKGAGHPLKAGGRSRPIVIAQKKTLGGIGKDRDESFAFWDHLYDVAAKSIKFKIPAEDAESNGEQGEEVSTQTFQRTQTGILSNRRPSTLPTPSSSKSSSPPTPSTSIISQAKQEAARRSLYSRFLRGPVITNETPSPESPDSAKLTENTTLPTNGVLLSPSTSAISLPAALPESRGLQVSNEDKKTRRVERAARKQARAERREAKAMRRAAREEKKARKAKEAARRAAKLKKKAEKESRKRLNGELTMTDPSAEQSVSSLSTDGERRKKDKKRKRG
ncbi:hypothetical protein FRC07_009711 [Ceratobasidium sp. 392]|nr:hypothetical protein FRC07_009711 [Ceratobasidium sp. 392]